MSGQANCLPVWDTITASWEKVSGSKATFWGAIGILAVIMFGIGVLEGITEKMLIVSAGLQIIGNILGYFLQLGLVYMGITRAKDMPINFKMVFHTLDLQMAIRLIGLYILQTLIFLAPVVVGGAGFGLTMLGGVMSVLGGLLMAISIIATIFIAIRLSLSMAFVLDTEIGPLAAIKNSYAATDGNFWNLVGIYLLQMIILFVSIIPLGIGLIWSLPLMLICYGMIYQKLRNNI